MAATAASASVSSAAYAKSAKKALDYLEERLLNDKWVSEHDDVAYYFKAPMAFLEAGRIEEAKKLLRLTLDRYYEHGGSQSTQPSYRNVYSHYPWVWMMWAAQRLGEVETCQKIWLKVQKCMDDATCAGIIKLDSEMDLFATSQIVKAAIVAGADEIAHKAARTLLQVLQANDKNMSDGFFLLRWTKDADDRIVLVDRRDDPQKSIVEGKSGQKFYMLGFPAQVLLELAQGEGLPPHQRDVYTEAANQFLKFLKTCDGVWSYALSHKVARAAVMAGDSETSTKIMDYIMSLQKPIGCYQEDPEAIGSIDQTAELAFWFQVVNRELKELDAKDTKASRLETGAAMAAAGA